jgi:hypothetical protein
MKLVFPPFFVFGKCSLSYISIIIYECIVLYENYGILGVININKIYVELL